jgi:hypothetical protein
VQDEFFGFIVEIKATKTPTQGDTGVVLLAEQFTNFTPQA